ncbi:MAG: hypothetical protein DBX61_01560 [Clostridiales bacterium]|nr:MAG: hypothetical protein DBX61_01560 [Clostridiales bacterium]
MRFLAFPPYCGISGIAVKSQKFDGAGSPEGKVLWCTFLVLFSYSRKKCGSNVPLQLSRTSKRK